MPYIKQEERGPLENTALKLGTRCETPGQLNFAISKVISAYLLRHGLTYATGSAVRGVLFDVAQEFYRRVLAPYEDRKCALHGDVYQWIPDWESLPDHEQLGEQQEMRQ